MRKLMVVGLFMVAMLTGAVRTADAGCATALGECFGRAADVDGFWWRWAAGIDCELDFIECARVKIIGT